MDYLVKDFNTEFFQVEGGFLKVVTEPQAVIRVIAVDDNLVQISYIQGHGQRESVFHLSKQVFYQLIREKNVVPVESIFEVDDGISSIPN